MTSSPRGNPPITLASSSGSFSSSSFVDTPTSSKERRCWDVVTEEVEVHPLFLPEPSVVAPSISSSTSSSSPSPPDVDHETSTASSQPKQEINEAPGCQKLRLRKRLLQRRIRRSVQRNEPETKKEETPLPDTLLPDTPLSDTNNINDDDDDEKEKGCIETPTAEIKNVPSSSSAAAAVFTTVKIDKTVRTEETRVEERLLNQNGVSPLPPVVLSVVTRTRSEAIDPPPSPPPHCFPTNHINKEEDNAAATIASSTCFYGALSSWTAATDGSHMSPATGAAAADFLTSFSDGTMHPNSYEFRDFNVEAWRDVLGDWENGAAPAVAGVAVVATAAFLIHPMVFFAGVGGAVGAFGTYRAAERGFEYFEGHLSHTNKESNEQQQQQQQQQTMSREENEATIITTDAVVVATEPPFDLIDHQPKHPSITNEKVTTTTATTAGTTSPDKSLEQSSSSSTSSPVPPLLPTVGETTIKENKSPTTEEQEHEQQEEGEESTVTVKHGFITNNLTKNEFLRQLPCSEPIVLSQVPFTGLSAMGFFRVFFGDDAPYGMKEFQQRRGDVDVVYGKWERISGNEKKKKNSNSGGGDNNDMWYGDLPSTTASTTTTTAATTTVVKRRILRFKTPTKSYFGPAFATAIKTQIATHISNDLLYVENHTSLMDIPYGDRFCVVEQWLIQSNRHLVSTLSVRAGVRFNKSCPWESIIRKKTTETMKGTLGAWCERAKKAMEVAEQTRLQRLSKRHIHDLAYVVVAPSSSSLTMTTVGSMVVSTTTAATAGEGEGGGGEKDDCYDDDDEVVVVVAATEAATTTTAAESSSSSSSNPAAEEEEEKNLILIKEPISDSLGKSVIETTCTSTSTNNNNHEFPRPPPPPPTTTTTTNSGKALFKARLLRPFFSSKKTRYNIIINK